jgi:hypothetical protein
MSSELTKVVKETNKFVCGQVMRFLKKWEYRQREDDYLALKLQE